MGGPVGDEAPWLSNLSAMTLGATTNYTPTLVAPQVRTINYSAAALTSTAGKP